MQAPAWADRIYCTLKPWRKARLQAAEPLCSSGRCGRMRRTRSGRPGRRARHPRAPTRAGADEAELAQQRGLQGKIGAAVPVLDTSAFPFSAVGLLIANQATNSTTGRVRPGRLLSNWEACGLSRLLSTHWQ